VRYLLDANVLSYFLQCRREGDLATSATVVPLAIAEEVYDEVVADRQRGAHFRRWFPQSNITKVPVLVGSSAHQTLNDLSANLATRRGAGERASIAIAANNSEFVFVANDKGALWIALRELHLPGERVLGLAVFLKRLRDLGGLPLDAVVAAMTVSDMPKPTWWAPWVATQQA
jgi:hypothetical protein